MFKIFRSNSMDTGNKIIIILLILIAIASLVCGFLFISNGLANSDDTELQENVTNVTNTTIMLALVPVLQVLV